MLSHEIDICMDRLETLATMVAKHEQAGDMRLALTLHDSAKQLTAALDSDDEEIWVVQG